MSDYDDDPAYVAFLERPGAGAKSIHAIQIGVQTGLLPEIDDTDPVFRSGQTWGMLTDGSGYTLIFWRGLEAVRELYMVAKADGLTSEVSVWYQPNLPETMGNTPKIWNPIRYPLDQILLMNHLAYRGGVIVHSAGLVLDGVGLVFAGFSGAGKSTLTHVLKAQLPGALLLSDDRIIVRRKDGTFRMYGTPWPGEAGIAVNGSADLRALFFLTKASQNLINPLRSSEAARRLFPVISCPWYDPERLSGVLDSCEKLVSKVPCFELQFRPEPEVAEMLVTFVEGGLQRQNQDRMAGG